jgi:hypothetical protein
MNYRFLLAATSCLLLTAQSTPAQNSSDTSRSPLPTSIASSALPTVAGNQAPQATAYASLQQTWDDCASIKSNCSELLDEGRFAPARKKWVDYYTSNLSTAVSDLQKVFSQTQFSPDLKSSVQGQWQSAGASIDTLQKQIQALQSVASSVKDPTDDKYPAAFWGPARDLLHTANDLDKSLVSILAILDNSTNAVPVNNLKGSVSNEPSMGSLEGLVKASQKIGDNCTQMAGELERMNLSFGKAPSGPLTNEFYQGAFTKQEILSQYKYMPSFVFTTDPSVARFTYRMPPRRNMLAQYTMQIGKLLNIMDSELQDIQSTMPPAKKDALSAPWQSIEKNFIDARNQYLTLYNLLKTTTDDKLAADIRQDETTFGPPVMALRRDMSQLRDAVNDFVSIAK